MTTFRQIAFLVILLVTLTLSASAAPAVVNGKVSDTSGSPVIGATVVIANNTSSAKVTDKNGEFSIKCHDGEQSIEVSFIGYDTYQSQITLLHGESNSVNITLQDASTAIERVVVSGESESAKVNKTAYNVQSMEIGAMKNSSANITQAMSKMSGINIRESGGVGSDTQLNLNGFNGSHVKIFIDGIPQNGNDAFSLNNIPAGFAERIEMYSGVVPIEFGADALGGVVNIITNKAHQSNRMNIDASYSYGSFNTHKTFVKFSQTLAKSGFTYSFNVYQNYSDNNYDIDSFIKYYQVAANGNVLTDYDRNDIVEVTRFHDTYHNETAIASIGFQNTSWADHMTLSFNYSQYYKDIQTGTTQDQVYGEKYAEGYSLTPTFEYSKRDFFTRGLDVRLTANYDGGHTHNADPSTGSYNWLGEYAETNLTPSDSDAKNSNWSTNFMAKYVSLNNKHNITGSNALTSTSRITRSIIDGTNIYSDYGTPQRSLKSVSGLSYLIRPIEEFEGTAFLKNYYQANEGVVEDESTGLAEFETRFSSNTGYGAAATYFIIPTKLQSKLSYERAYRLPTSTEMFGDNDLEVGTFDLDPETSDNINFNLVYTQTFKSRHFLRVDGSLIYRNTHDYIIRSASSDGTSASYGNYGRVRTTGYSIIARYDFDRYFSVGGTFNNLNAIDMERYISETSSQLNMTYGMQIPNQPYMYASGDATINFYNIFSDHDQISIIYDIFYQSEFTLNWAAVADPSTKAKVPTQLSHSMTINYSFQNSRYNISLEARNISDEDLFDNYSLQKAGRAYYAKFRVNIFK